LRSTVVLELEVATVQSLSISAKECCIDPDVNFFIVASYFLYQEDTLLKQSRFHHVEDGLQAGILEVIRACSY
jgi:hypothetical protein